MLQASRISAVIEILHEVEASAYPADRVIGYYFNKRRYMGSKDRGYIAELSYQCIRLKAPLEWHVDAHQQPRNARSMVIAALMLLQEMPLDTFKTLFKGGDQYAPPALRDTELVFARKLEGKPLIHKGMPEPVKASVPEWLFDTLKAAYPQDYLQLLQAMTLQAPLDLRANTLKASREQVKTALETEGYAAEYTPIAPNGLRLQNRAPVFSTAAFQEGLMEVQDEGSQIVCGLVEAKPGERVLDFCAGAGGKTLSIAARMQNKGQIYACDTSAKRLEELKKRLKRAGVDNVQIKPLENENDPYLKRHKDAFDWVLLDVPCSGSGTWRRSPDLKWRTTPAKVADYAAIQARIITRAAGLVKPGGHIVYITCSLLPEENERQIENFLTIHPYYSQRKQEKLLPNHTGTDGFFACVLQRT